ncbi:MAG: AmmeMemoRadiSam system protein B [Elusimicrobiota bacterium]|nr:AmmeMemoRadiSam system protein B [Elusimicrobiota bacterium]
MRARLEAVPAEEDGKPVFVLRDLEDLTDKPLALSGGGMLLVSLLDGQRTAAQLRDEFLKNSGAVLEIPVILDLVSALDEAGYLETPAIAEKRVKAAELFRGNPRRPAVFAGPSYPAEALPLAGALGRFFTAEKGPGKGKSVEPSKPAPLGLIAPHIDFTRGGPAYAWAYQALSERTPPDVVIALGVAHVGPNSPWVFTPKSYETPFGPMEVEDDLYQKLSGVIWYEPRADEWVHKHEHSLEFQAVWLKYLWREAAPKWIPILVSSFERFSPDEAPSKIPTIEKALKDLGDVLKAELAKGRTVMILSGIDLAHVGLRFGDDLEITPELEKKIEAEDRKSLIDAMALDADGFYKSVVADGHWRKVCGLSALYTGLRLMKAIGATQPGRLLSYGQAPDPAGGLVSFASAIYDR